MKESEANILRISTQQVNEVRYANKMVTEKTLHIRCLSYIAEVKAQLLTQTIFEIEKSKKVLKKINLNLNEEILKRKNAESQLQERIKLLAMSVDIGKALTEIKDLQLMLRRCSHFIVNHLGVAFVRIWILNETEQALELQATAGMYTHTDSAHARAPVGQFKIGLIARERKPYLTNDVQNDPCVAGHEWARREGMVSFAGYPLLVKDRLIGVVAMFAKERLPDATIDALGLVSNQIALGIEHLQNEADLLIAKEKAEAATRVKSEFLANISHELRTPMNSIIGFTGRVIRKAGDLIPEKQLKNLRTVERNSYHLLHLINSLLDISKVEAGKMEIFPEKFTLNPLISEIVELAGRMVIGKELEIITDISEKDVMLYTDKPKLKQILINLVSNSVMFTEKGNITITSAMVKEGQTGRDTGSDCIAISVADTGIGMSRDEIGYIFEPFTQADSATTRKVGGTGLGLTLTKNFTELLHGKVRVESEKHKGTTITIIIPVNISDASVV